VASREMSSNTVAEERVLATAGLWRVTTWNRGSDRNATIIDHACICRVIGCDNVTLVSKDDERCSNCYESIPTQIRAIALTADLCH